MPRRSTTPGSSCVRQHRHPKRHEIGGLTNLDEAIEGIALLWMLDPPRRQPVKLLKSRIGWFDPAGLCCHSVRDGAGGRRYQVVTPTAHDWFADDAGLGDNGHSWFAHVSVGRRPGGYFECKARQPEFGHGE